MNPSSSESAAISCPSCGPKPNGGVYCPDCGEVLLHGTSRERYESDRVIWEFGPEETLSLIAEIDRLRLVEAEYEAVIQQQQAEVRRDG